MPPSWGRERTYPRGAERTRRTCQTPNCPGAGGTANGCVGIGRRRTFAAISPDPRTPMARKLRLTADTAANLDQAVTLGLSATACQGQRMAGKMSINI